MSRHPAFDATSHVPLRTQLEDLLRAEVASGTYRVGDRVPTVRELADAYGVGKTTAASAIETLVREGLLAAKRQRGTTVRADRQCPIRIRVAVHAVNDLSAFQVPID